MARILRKLFVWMLGLGAVAAVALGLVWAFVLEPAPLVERRPRADPEIARDAKNFVHQVRELDEVTDATPVLSTNVKRLQSVADFGARLVPGARGLVGSEGDTLTFRGSLPVPYVPGGRWLNVEAAVPAYEGRATFSRIAVGGIGLPPVTTTALLEGLANLVMGDALGTKVRQAVPRLEVDGPRVHVVVLSTPRMRNAFTRSTFGMLRSDEMPTGEEIRVHYVALREAVESGRLPDSGSFLPYVRWSIESALARAEPGREDHEFTAALFALARACGASKFGLVVGRLIDGIVAADETPWSRDCQWTVLRGAVDKRRHFITAAAIKAASTMRISFAIGEFKELVDSLGDRGVFDFTDIVANASGIRFAETVMAVPPAEWPALVSRLRSEEDVIARFDGVPTAIPWSEFEARFDRVDSPAYRAMVETIERRIDGLAFHEGQPPWDGTMTADLIALGTPAEAAARQ